LRKYLSIIFVSLFLFHSISASAAEKIVILPFESLAKEDISFIQGVIPKLLSSRLSDMTGWEAVSVEATTADETVKKYGPVYLVSGSVTKLGETYSLDIILREKKRWPRQKGKRKQRLRRSSWKVLLPYRRRGKSLHSSGRGKVCTAAGGGSA
jgi:hypothetical protein